MAHKSKAELELERMTAERDHWRKLAQTRGKSDGLERQLETANMPHNLAVHSDATGRYFALQTTWGLCISAPSATEQLRLMNQANLTQNTIHNLMAWGEGERRKNPDILRELLGQLANTGAQIVSYCAQVGAPPEYIHEHVTARFVAYENALQAGIEGNLHPLEDLVANTTLGWFSDFIDQVTEYSTRGHRDVDQQTLVLGEHTAAVHLAGQDWLLTGRKVRERLDPLRNVYSWVPAVLSDLYEALDTRDRVMIRNILENPRKQWLKHQTLTRGKRGRQPR